MCHVTGSVPHKNNDGAEDKRKKNFNKIRKTALQTTHKAGNLTVDFFFFLFVALSDHSLTIRIGLVHVENRWRKVKMAEILNNMAENNRW